MNSAPDSFKVLRSLYEICVDSGYIDYYQTFGDGNLSTIYWAKGLSACNSNLKILVRLFLLKDSLSPEDVSKVIRQDLLDQLLHHKILSNQQSGFITSNEYVLLCFQRFIFFCNLGSSPSVYFGADSIALAVRQRNVKGLSVLDLCSGSGIQAMIASSSASNVIGIERNETAANVARVNCAINGVSDNVQVIHSSLETFAVSSPTFDVILCNPPLLPIPLDLPFAAVGDGGENGTQILRLALDFYASRMNAGGYFQAICAGIGCDGTFSAIDELASRGKDLGLKCQATVTSRFKMVPGSVFFENLVDSCCMYSPELPRSSVTDRVMQSLRRNVANEVFFFTVIFSTKDIDQYCYDATIVGYGDWFV
jgi:release factor glutamine methyltransferase